LVRCWRLSTLSLYLLVPSVLGEEIIGVNPKVNNLVRSYARAAHDILWVLDSNVMADPGTLGRSVDALINSSPKKAQKKRIAMVHHVPFAFVNEPQLGSQVEEAFLNTNHAKMYIAINTVALESCVVGKSNLYRRSDADKLNGSLKPHPPPPSETLTSSADGYGLRAFGRYLAEDNMIASALWHELDVRHELSCDVARNAIGNMTLSDYIWRRVRWIRVRKHMVLTATILEPLTECIVLSLLASWSIRRLSGIPMWLVLLIHYPLWIAVDLDVYESLAGHPLPLSRLRQFLGAWLLREFLAFPIWCVAIVGSEVVWRGKTYRMLRNGEVEHAVGEGYLSSLLKRLRGTPRRGHYERLDNPTNT
jgi:ceramide glucosyltransferase